MPAMDSDRSIPPVAPSARGKRAPSSAHKRHNNNNRNHSKSNPQFDGAVSDGALAHSTTSPHPKQQTHKQRQSVAIAATPIQQNANMGKTAAPKQRPVSMSGHHIAASPAKEQAYAGPTFQSSPAASSLPKPKFFSKSLPGGADPSSLQSRLAAESTPDEPQSSPESDTVVPVPPREESPLDFFFKADKAEKEKVRTSSNSLSPEAALRSPPPNSATKSPFQQTGKNLFLRELDGDDENMPSPRTIPTNNRPAPGRTVSSPGSVPRVDGSDDERQAKTRNLKELLFNAASSPSPTPPRRESRNPSGSQTPEGFFGPPSPYHRSTSGPSTPQPGPEQQNHYVYYGNRNLSPMFKAARADTPPRPSSLRQEVPGDGNPGQMNHPASVDSSSFARSYLQEQIRTSGPAEMPQLPTNFPRTGAFDHMHRQAPLSPVNAQHGVPRTGARDVSGMEDDIRRMLKIA